LTATGSIAAGCDTDPNECTLKKLCEVATAIDGENTIWSTEPSSEKHVSTAKNLDLKCGITPISDACDESPSDCKLKQLCGKATKELDGRKIWDKTATAYVDLAKEYGLQCDVGEDTVPKNPMRDFKQSFLFEPKLKRQQIQFALKKLGYYKYGIDGAWGQGTRSGLDKFDSTFNLHGKNVTQVFEILLSKVVNVPSSFNNAPTTKTASTSNSNNKRNGNKSFDCKRIGLPATGFANAAAAKSWYPARIWLEIAADKSWMKSSYGTDKERTPNEKQNNLMMIDVGSNIVKIDGKNLRDQKESTIYISVLVKSGGYKQVAPARYRCSKAK